MRQKHHDYGLQNRWAVTLKEGLALFGMGSDVEVPGWQVEVQHKDNTFQNSGKEKQYVKGWWICPSLRDEWRLDDRDRNVLETVGRSARVKGITLDGQLKVPFNLEV